MRVTRLKDIVIDARYPSGLARFRATVLGYELRPYEREDVEFLASFCAFPALP